MTNYQLWVETALKLNGMSLRDLYDFYNCTRPEWIRALGPKPTQRLMKLRSRLLKDALKNSESLFSVLNGAK